MAYYQTPETVQRSAEEYLKLDKEAGAFDLLVNYMSGRRSRQWGPAMDKIMTMIIDLAIKFNKKALIKEPLANFRFATQSANIPSFENAILYFVSATEDQKKGIISNATPKILEMEDLENEDPEELFICALDSAPTEKTLIRHALRDVWETYRLCLETVARNKKLEDLYGQIAKKAFEFCRQYNRRTEFKRLCETMRGTLTSLIRTMQMNPNYNKIPNAIDLTNSETNEKQIVVRFDMLEYTEHFHLWQESLKILEDIHNIMMKRRGAIKPKILSDYFENLAKTFWRSEFYLYHAIAYFNHYTLIRTRNRNIKDEEMTQKTCFFVLSVLCIPPVMSETLQSEDARSKAIALLSSEATIPSKQELITYIHKHNLLDICTQEVRELFYLIEEGKNMVSLAKDSEPFLNVLKGKKDGFQNFHKPLQHIVIYKLLGLLSKLYTKLKIESFTRFLGSLDYSFCEKIIHSANNVEHIKVRIDHQRRLLVFQDDVEDMQSLSLMFANFSEDLKEVIYSIENKREEAQEQKVIDGLRGNARRFNDSARSALGQRQKLIENLKRSVLETFGKRTVEETRPTRNEPVAAPVAVSGSGPVAGGKSKQAIQKRLDDLEEQNKASLLKKLLKIKGFKIGNKKLEDMKEDEIGVLTSKKLEEAREAWELKEREKDEAAVKNAFKRADFLERAKREEHISILKSQWAVTQDEKEEIMKVHKESFTQKLEFKAKIQQAAEWRAALVKTIEKERKEAYDEQLDEFNEKIIENFREKILTLATESLKVQREAEAEEEKKKEEDLKKQRERIEKEREVLMTEDKPAFTGFQRGGLSREEMQKKQQEETKKDEVSKFTRGPAQDGQKAAAPAGILRRPAEEKPNPFTGLRRADGESGEPSKPKFINASKKEGEEKKNPFGDARPVATAQPTQVAAPADDGWRTTATTTKKKEEPPKFTRGPTSGAPSSGPPKFTRGGDSNASGNTQSGGGWRK